LLELGVCIASTVAATWLLERPLLREATGYVFSRRSAAAG